MCVCVCVCSLHCTRPFFLLVLPVCLQCWCRVKGKPHNFTSSSVYLTNKQGRWKTFKHTLNKSNVGKKKIPNCLIVLWRHFISDRSSRPDPSQMTGESLWRNICSFHEPFARAWIKPGSSSDFTLKNKSAVLPLPSLTCGDGNCWKLPASTPAAVATNRFSPHIAHKRS